MFFEDNPQHAQQYLNRFLSYCQQRFYEKDSILFQPGDLADTLYFIIEGTVSITVNNDKGQALEVAEAKEGEFLGEMGLFVEQPHRNVTTITKRDSTIATISYIKLQHMFKGPLGKEHKDLLILLGTQISQRLLQTNQKVETMTFPEILQKQEKA